MKITRQQLSRIIKESLEDNSEFISKLLQMAQSGHGHYLQAKEIASSMSLNVDLEMEYLKLIKRELDQLLASKSTIGTLYTKMVDRDWWTEFEPFMRGITLGYKSNQPDGTPGHVNSFVYGSVYLGGDAIKMKWYKDHWSRPQSIVEFDSVSELLSYLSEEL